MFWFICFPPKSRIVRSFFLGGLVRNSWTLKCTHQYLSFCGSFGKPKSWLMPIPLVWHFLTLKLLEFKINYLVLGRDRAEKLREVSKRPELRIIGSDMEISPGFDQHIFSNISIGRCLVMTIFRRFRVFAHLSEIQNHSPSQWYTRYILPIGWLYATYHLLRENQETPLRFLPSTVLEALTNIRIRESPDVSGTDGPTEGWTPKIHISP